MAEKVDRLTRINELLKREIADLIERGQLPASGMLVSVTEVRASVDLKNATVCISIFGGDKAARQRVMDELEFERAGMQSHLARACGFKHTPVLNFKLDRRTELGDRVLEMLNRADQDDREESGNGRK